MAKRKYASLDEVPEVVLEKLGKFVTNVRGRTFFFHGLPPELIGGVMARYSRAPTGLQLTLINEFLNESGEPDEIKGTELMDRVLNSFGDDSIGEQGIGHVGIEDVSQLLTKFIEDRRIGGSPIEQSTRYVKYDQKDSEGGWRYLRPKEIMLSELGEKFESANNCAFEVYSKSLGVLSEHFSKKFPRAHFKIEVEREGKKTLIGTEELQNERERREFRIAYNFTVRCAALDIARGVLPASTLTHLGLLGNARFYTNLLSFLKSEKLTECRERAVELEAELNKVIPTFIKRNSARTRNQLIDEKMRDYASRIFEGIRPEAQRVTLVDKAEYLDEIVASILFPYSSISLQQIINKLKKISREEKIKIHEEYNSLRNSRRDRSGRGLEAGYPLVFDLVGNFAEYRDLERHRMLTQQRQMLSTNLGFFMYPEIREVGLEKEVEEVVSKMEDLNSDLKHAGLVQESQYATLFNHRIRFMLGMNLREFQHLAELRTQRGAHFSYKSMVLEMADKAIEKYPFIKDALKYVDYTDPDNRMTRAREQGRIAGKNLALEIDGAADY